MTRKEMVSGVKYTKCPKCYHDLRYMHDLVYRDGGAVGVVQSCKECKWKNHYVFKVVEEDET